MSQSLQDPLQDLSYGDENSYISVGLESMLIAVSPIVSLISITL